MAGQPVPVEACAGWLNSCPFCDKRFSTWISTSEEDAVSSVPPEPGAFMFAFGTKRGKEIVAIGIHKTNMQTSVIPQLRDLRGQISEKKSKETKACILMRYAVLENTASREACSIYTHWYNYGILPRLTQKWPGLAILKNSEDFEYSEGNQKWCYPVKDPVWRKQKVNAEPQSVSKCKGWTENCSYCDDKFTNWLRAEEATSRKESDGGAPERTGFCTYASYRKGKREIIHISTNTSIREDIKHNAPWLHNNIRFGRIKEFDPILEVRWMTTKNMEDTESCFMLAHLLNCGKVPAFSREIPGVEILEKSENFVFRPRDKRWCYDDGQAACLKTVSKTKERRNILRSALEDLHMRD